jgi:hypothetical protein
MKDSNVLLRSLNSKCTRWCIWSGQYTTSPKSRVSIPDGVIIIFDSLNPSGRAVALGSKRSYFLGINAVGVYDLQPYQLHVPIVWTYGSILACTGIVTSLYAVRTMLLVTHRLSHVFHNVRINESNAFL